jgi:MFS family permease
MDQPPSSPWLNRTVVGAGLTSFLADVGYEMATAVLPAFLQLLGIHPDSVHFIVGLIESVSDFLSNAVKLLVGWHSDRIGHRKAFVVAGYALTGSAFALCALALAWPLVLVAKSLAWIGKGLRGPLRNAILADSVEPAHHGKAFGFHRAGDTLGAIAGPLLGAALIAWLPAAWFATADEPYRVVFLVTLIPGLGAALAFALLVREKRFTPKPGLRLGASIRALPTSFRRYLAPVFVFGLGDFSHMLLISAATVLLTPKYIAEGFSNGEAFQIATTIAISLYALKNGAGALAAFPAGWLGDRWGHRSVLVGGYLLGATTMIGFGVLFVTETRGVVWVAVLFATAGIYIAVQEALEPAITADLVPDRAARGTAFGVLAAVNGLGDVFASVGIGALFLLGPSVGFATAAGLMLAGTLWLALGRRGAM